MIIDQPLHLKYAALLNTKVEFLTDKILSYVDGLSIYEWRKGEMGLLSGVVFDNGAYKLLCDDSQGDYVEVLLEDVPDHIKLLAC